jgi:hypothetical protein
MSGRDAPGPFDAQTGADAGKRIFALSIVELSILAFVRIAQIASKLYMPTKNAIYRIA